MVTLALFYLGKRLHEQIEEVASLRQLLNDQDDTSRALPQVGSIEDRNKTACNERNMVCVCRVTGCGPTIPAARDLAFIATPNVGPERGECVSQLDRYGEG
jgi:hypothetical protein